MPQSSDEMRELMKTLFGGESGIEDGPPTEFLQARGYKLLKGWTWEPPTTDHWMSIKEELAIRFLIEEWDFGGIEDASKDTDAHG